MADITTPVRHAVAPVAGRGTGLLPVSGQVSGPTPVPGVRAEVIGVLAEG